MRLFLTLIAAWLFACPAMAAETPPVDTGEVLGQVVSSHDSVTPGQTFHVALSTVLNEGWHTYWLNPGDSGEPVEFTITPAGNMTLGNIVWPLPKPVPTGPIVNYGFEGAPLFPVPVTVSPDAKPGDILTFSGNAYYLVCREICIPEDFDFSLDVSVSSTAQTDNRWNRNINKAIAASATPADSRSTVRLENGRLVIDAMMNTAGISDPYIFPIDPGTILHSDAQAIKISDDGIAADLSPGFGMADGIPGDVEYLLTYEKDGDYAGRFIKAEPGAALITGASPVAVTPSGPAVLTLWTALIGAFIGGLILNLMPCVFPIISIKALGFVNHAHGSASALRTQGWMYTFGVLATFALLTAILLLLKAGGAQIGWGFQLQSPWLVGLLALLLFAIGLNLMGAFEFGGAISNIGSGVKTSGKSGAFWTGALAVIVATPCTAPFMAGAVGFALAQPAFVTILVFAGLAIGFALPVLALSYAPKLLSKLPKPGPWMERLKEFLAFPMFAAAVWLVWVLSLQAGSFGLLKILAAMVILGLAIWLLARSGAFAKVLGIAALAGALILPLTISAAPIAASVQKDAAYTVDAWSPQTVREYQAQGRAVFVDFTAAWCVTCKVNELGALSDKDVKAAFADTDTVKLIADWTNKNDEIAAELERFGRAGVPLYLYYGADNNGQTPQVLPQILTESILISALNSGVSK